MEGGRDQCVVRSRSRSSCCASLGQGRQSGAKSIRCICQAFAEEVYLHLPNDRHTFGSMSINPSSRQQKAVSLHSFANTDYSSLEEVDDRDVDGEVPAGPVKNKLSMFFGVFQPCVLSIFGAILFLRLPWAIGNAGWAGVLSMFLLGGLTVTLTTMSIAAISTNGRVKGGGAYYMISRSLGAEFGGSVGLVYFLASAIGITFYLTAFSEVFVTIIPGFDAMDATTQYWYQFMVGSVALLLLFIQAQIGASFFLKLNSALMAILSVAIICGFASFLTAAPTKHGVDGFVGPNAKTFWANTWPQDIPRQCACTIIPNKHQTCGNDNVPNDVLKCVMADCAYNSASNDTFILSDTEVKKNGCGVPDQTAPKDVTHENTGYFDVFVVIFPAVTGIMAGANMSGDLADPGASIGRGTLLALAFTITVYMLLTLVIAASVEAHALKTNLNIFEDCSYSGALIVGGVMTSTLSCAMSGIVGSARVLQALARDKLIPILNVFSYGSMQGDEPRVALFLSYFFAQVLLLETSLNALSMIVSNLMLLVYCFVNFACFVLRVSGAPNFRPEFRYFNWQTAGGGAFLSAMIMFIASPMYGFVAIIVILLLSVVVHYIAPVVPWGDVTQVVIYHQVRKYLLRLDVRKEHPKFWRPSILLALDRPHECLNLIDVTNDLKKGGLLIIGNVLRGQPTVSLAAASRDLREAWYSYIDKAKIKAFFELNIAPTNRVGFNNLTMSAGLGGMKVNTVIVQYYTGTATTAAAVTHSRKASNPYQRPGVFEKQVQCEDILRRITTTLEACDNSPSQDGAEFLETINDALLFRQNVLIAKGFEDVDKEMIIAYKKRARRVSMTSDCMTIDVWSHASRSNGDWDNLRGNLSLSLQLAYGLQRQGVWKTHTKLRAIVAVEVDADTEGDMEDLAMDGVRERLTTLLKQIRVSAELTVFSTQPIDRIVQTNLDTPSHGQRDFNDVIVEKSRTTALCFIPLPALPDNRDLRKPGGKASEFIKSLDDLTKDLPPTLLVGSAHQATMSLEL